MKTTYQSQNFKESDVASVYIAYNVYGDTLKQYDVNSKGFTIRESIVNVDSFSAEIVAKAYSMKEKAFKQIKVA